MARGLVLPAIFGNSQLANDLRTNRFGQSLGQFGWHFEYQVIPEGGGPQLVIQYVLDFRRRVGKFFPTTTLALGVRLPDGIKLGYGADRFVRQSYPYSSDARGRKEF